jgi:hypothetical protein
VHTVRLPVQRRIVLEKCDELTHINNDDVQVVKYSLHFFLNICITKGEKETLGRIEFRQGECVTHPNVFCRVLSMALASEAV